MTSPALPQALDPQARAALDGTLNASLEAARTGVEVPWRELTTGRGGIVIVERTFFLAPDRPCRAYRWTAEQPGGPTLRGQGTGCRIARDRWSLQEDSSLAAPAAVGTSPAAPAATGAEPAPQPRPEPAPPAKQARSAAPQPPKKPAPPAYTLPSATPL
jgi:hypothetical protein